MCSIGVREALYEPCDPALHPGSEHLQENCDGGERSTPPEHHSEMRFLQLENEFMTTAAGT